MIFLIINLPKFVDPGSRVDPEFLPPCLKFLWSIALRLPIGLTPLADTTDKRTVSLCRFVCLFVSYMEYDTNWLTSLSVCLHFRLLHFHTKLVDGKDCATLKQFTLAGCTKTYLLRTIRMYRGVSPVDRLTLLIRLTICQEEASLYVMYGLCELWVCEQSWLKHSSSIIVTIRRLQFLPCTWICAFRHVPNGLSWLGGSCLINLLLSYNVSVIRQ